jgi:hypothetical protein
MIVHSSRKSQEVSPYSHQCSSRAVIITWMESLHNDMTASLARIVHTLGIINEPARPNPSESLTRTSTVAPEPQHHYHGGLQA